MTGNITIISQNKNMEGVNTILNDGIGPTITSSNPTPEMTHVAPKPRRTYPPRYPIDYDPDDEAYYDTKCSCVLV